MHQEAKYDDRQEDKNWQLTSTGVGHFNRPGYFFPDSEFQILLRNPLPAKLAGEDAVNKEKQFLTTKEYFHDRKFPGLLYGNPIHMKAPGHWKIDYIKDLTEKLGHSGWRRPLTMGNQKSEMKDQYQANAPEVKDPYKFEVGVASTQNPKLQGKPYNVKDKGLLAFLDPYLSVTQRDHHFFTPAELNGYAKKDIPTIHDCEGKRQAGGIGLKHNPMPKDSVPRDLLPMRDELIFPSATRIPRPPKSNVPVPHGGLKTLYEDSYQAASHVNMKENYYCPVDTPFRLPEAGSKSIFTAPKMYQTEYQNIGSRKSVTVSK